MKLFLRACSRQQCVVLFVCLYLGQGLGIVMLVGYIGQTFIIVVKFQEDHLAQESNVDKYRHYMLENLTKSLLVIICTIVVLLFLFSRKVRNHAREGDNYLWFECFAMTSLLL